MVIDKKKKKTELWWKKKELDEEGKGQTALINSNNSNVCILF